MKIIKELVDALETGAFHHPKCPWYNGKKCLCPNKKVKKVMEKLGDLK